MPSGLTEVVQLRFGNVQSGSITLKPWSLEDQKVGAEFRADLVARLQPSGENECQAVGTTLGRYGMGPMTWRAVLEFLLSLFWMRKGLEC